MANRHHPGPLRGIVLSPFSPNAAPYWTYSPTSPPDISSPPPRAVRITPLSGGSSHYKPGFTCSPTHCMQPLAAPNRHPEILFRRFLDSEFPAAAPHDLIACSVRLAPNNHTASARPNSRCGRSLSVPALLDLYSKICREVATTFETLRVMRDAQCVTRD